MTTLSVLNTGDGQNVDVSSIIVPNKAAFVLIETVANGDTREAIYQKVGGDPEYPMTVRVGFYKTPSANGGVGVTNVSVKIATYVQKTDVDDVIWTLPAYATLALSMPGGNPIPDMSDVSELIGNLFGWFIPVADGVPSTSALSELQFGVVGGLLAHANSASV